MPQSFLLKPELVDEDDFYVFAFGVKFLNSGVEDCFAAGEVGPALAVRDGPVVACFHIEDVAASSLADLGGEHIHHGGFAFTCECLIEVFEDAEVSPESFTANQAGNVREDEVGRVAEEVEAILLEFAFGAEFFLDGGFVGVNAVINDADIFGFKFGREEPQLIGNKVADGENGIAVFGGIDERVFEVPVLRAENVLDVEFLLVRFFDDVIKHCVVAGVVLDDFSHCGNFVGVEDGFVIAGLVEDGGHRGWHTHILVGDDDGFVCCGADDFEYSQGGGGETDILFEVPEVFVAVAFDVKLFEQSGFKFVDGAGVGIANIEEDDFRRGFDCCLGIDEGSSAVDYADVIERFDSGEGGGIAGLSEAVERRVKYFARRSEPVENRALGGEERTNNNRAFNDVEV